MKASQLGKALSARTKAKLDRVGRIYVNSDLTLPKFPSIFIIGDLAHFSHQDDGPLPGVAPVALQQGRYVAHAIKHRLKGRKIKPFRYRNKGSLAVIGRHAAVADFGFLRFSGAPTWLLWMFVHIGYLIEFDNKIIVLFQWAWNYFTRKKRARLITGDHPFPLVKNNSKKGERLIIKSEH